MGLSNLGLDNPCLRGLFNMGSDRLFDPMSDCIFPMSKNPSDRLFDYFESAGEQVNDLLAESRSITCLRRAGQ